MWSKATLFGDAAAAARILAVLDPGAQKAIGKRVRGFDEAVWVRNRFGIVRQGNLAKFSQNPDLLERLRQTAGTTLVEASPTDRIWGIGLGVGDARCLRRATWRGLNLLGFAETEVRVELCGS